MFFVCLLMDAILFLSSNIALRLSWNRTLSSMLKPCASIKYWVHSIWGMASSSPINYASVELLALILCFFAIPVTEPLPSDMVSPVCPLVYGCAMYEASTHHLITFRLYALRISGILVVRRTYRRTLFNFPQSSFSGVRTLAVRK